MVQAMGGVDSVGFHKFRSQCCLAYTLLRKHTSLIMNLLALMVDAGFGIFAKLPPATSLAAVQANFHLELDDDQAESHFLGLIDYSFRNLGVRVTEAIHKMAVIIKG
jgi:phosphatidylinositol 3-kinase